MPYTASQIVADACAEAKVPNYLALGGRKLNLILAELCDYDFDVNRLTFQFVFNPGIPDPLGVFGPGSGPYPLPTNWLRSNKDDVFYIIDGVKYVMIPDSLSALDASVAQGGLNAYPENYAVDNSAIATQGNPVMYVWPPPSGSFPVTCRYYAQMADIVTPETSTVIPWFPQQVYLSRRLTGEMMLISGDDRAPAYLGGQSKDGFEGASALLDRYLKTKDDAQVVKTVSLDRRRFGFNFNRTPNTKTIGW